MMGQSIPYQFLCGLLIESKSAQRWSPDLGVEGGYTPSTN